VFISWFFTVFFTCLAILFVTYEVELWVGVNLLTYAYKFKFN